MDRLFDDISRILASPIPRRRAVKLIAGGLAGAALAVFGPRRAVAFACGSGTFACGTKCCNSSTQKCCGGTSCCATSVACCGTNGDKCCAVGDVCVNFKCQKQSP